MDIFYHNTEMCPNQLFFHLAKHSFELLYFRRIFTSIITTTKIIKYFVDGFNQLPFVLNFPDLGDCTNNTVTNSPALFSFVVGRHIVEVMVNIFVPFILITIFKEVGKFNHFDLTFAYQTKCFVQ